VLFISCTLTIAVFTGGYLRDYRLQWMSFFSPFPVVT